MKIVFVGHKSSLSMGFSEALQASSWPLLMLSPGPDLDREISNGEVALLVFAPTGKPEDWQQCHSILAKYPLLPAIYIMPNDHLFLKQTDVRAHRVVIKPLTRIHSFLNRVGELFQLGEHLMKNSKSSSNQAVVGQSFSMYNLDHVIDRVLADVASLSGATNAFWISAMALSGVVQKSLVVSETWPELDLNRRNLVRAHQDFQMDELSTTLQKFSQKSAQAASVQLQTVNEKGQSHLLVPVLDRSFGQPLAFVLLTQVAYQNLQQVAKTVEDRLNEYALIIDYSHKYQWALDQSYIDHLSGLYNDRYLRFALPEVVEHAKITQQKFAVLFMDVDYFKNVNDRNGHVVGSKVLRGIGDVVKSCLGHNDIAFRYGGDEYVVLSLGADVKKSQRQAEAIRQKIEQTPFTIDGQVLNVTVSIGLAVFPDHAQTTERIIQMADEAMYCSKNGSRNIVYVAS